MIGAGVTTIGATAAPAAEVENNGYVTTSAESFERSQFKRRYTVKKCGEDFYRFRSLSAKDYVEFCAAGGDNVTLCMLSVCNDKGTALYEEEEDLERLSGVTFDGLVLQQMANHAMEHCFKEGIEAKQDKAAGNS